MNANISVYAEEKSELISQKQLYFDWLSQHYPLLISENFEREYAEGIHRLVVASKKEQIPNRTEVVIRIDKQSETYRSLHGELLGQFDHLLAAAANDDQFGSEAREFLSYFVLSDGLPVFEALRQPLAEQGALVIQQLMSMPNFHLDLYSTVSGVIAYSQNARPIMRMIMLLAFEEYFQDQMRLRPSRRELAGVLYDALNLELRRLVSEQNFEYQNKLIELLVKHPHPATTAMLSVVAAEHQSEALRNSAHESIRHLQGSLIRMWEETIPDQVASTDFRAQCLAETLDLPVPDLDQAQSVFNACRGATIVNVDDQLLTQINVLLTAETDAVRLAAAISLAYIYAFDPACDVAGRAILVLTDWAVNSTSGRFVSDALKAIKQFESVSISCAQKVETAYIAANQKFILHNASSFTALSNE